ncbi:hypothetical protein EAO77_37260 [Streptomyces sp. t39]|nr:hypothetical protein EAO77_37260 [Streptomyces sp. t39]
MEQILADPENSSRTASEVAELVIEALDDIRSRTHRLAVVGQIAYEPQGPVHTVVLGPFSARGILDTQEKFQKATEGGCAARGVGEMLAWDTKTGKGRGRFMLAPAFLKPRDAWDFYRGETAAELAIEAAADPIIRGVVPVCLCGLKVKPRCRWCGGEYEHSCPRHQPDAVLHRCKR